MMSGRPMDFLLVISNTGYETIHFIILKVHWGESLLPQLQRIGKRQCWPVDRMPLAKTLTASQPLLSCLSRISLYFKYAGLDIMSSKLAHIQIPISKAVQDPRYLAPEQISCGSTVSACVTKGGDAYMWGTGFGSQLRIPTLLPVNHSCCA